MSAAAQHNLDQLVLSHTLANLISTALILLAYLTFLLWRDYVSTILCAFIVSQALHKLSNRLKNALKRLKKNAKKNHKQAHTQNQHTITHIWRLLKDAPPLLTFGLLQIFLLLHEYTSWGWPAAITVASMFFAAAQLRLLDFRFLAHRPFLSDDQLVIFALAGLGLVAIFVVVALIVQSLVDFVLLLVHTSRWTRARVTSDDSVAAVFEQAVSSAKEMAALGVASRSQLDGRWSNAARALELLDDPASNVTIVVEAIFDAARDLFPQVRWRNVLLQRSGELQRLVLWASGGDVYSAPVSFASPPSVGGALHVAWDWVRMAWSEHPHGEWRELLDHMLPPEWREWAADWRPVARGSRVLAEKLVGVLRMVAAGVYVLFSLGFSTIVFVTMTAYMLAAKEDVMTRIMTTVAPRLSGSTVDSFRSTIEAIIIVPVNSAAANATASLLLFSLYGVPYAHLAALVAVIFTLFPLTYSFFSCAPWVIGLLVRGHSITALLLILSMALLFWENDRLAELQLQKHAGIGQYVNGFSLVLGVYMFGFQGILFGPLLVCGVKRLYELGGAAIQQAAEDFVTPEPPHDRYDEFSGQEADVASTDMGTDGGTTEGQPSERATVGLQSFGSDISGKVLMTMRRLSFFSPSQDRETDPKRPSRIMTEPPRAATVRRSVSASDYQLHRAPTAYEDHHEIFVTCQGSQDSVRVCVRGAPTWKEFVRSTADRLAAAGLLSPDKKLVALYSSSGGRVGVTRLGCVEDLRHGETLHALLEPSTGQFSTVDQVRSRTPRSRLAQRNQLEVNEPGRSEVGGPVEEEQDGCPPEEQQGETDIVARPSCE